MALPKEVQKAISSADNDCDLDLTYLTRDEWHAIREYLLSQESEIAATEHRWEMMTALVVKKQRQIEDIESRLAAANALLRYVSRYLDPRHYDRAIKKIDEHLQGAGDEASSTDRRTPEVE